MFFHCIPLIYVLFRESPIDEPPEDEEVSEEEEEEEEEEAPEQHEQPSEQTSQPAATGEHFSVAHYYLFSAVKVSYFAFARGAYY